MPLNKKGKKILAAMKKQYGEKKGKSVLYASENSGKLKGITKAAEGAEVRGWVLLENAYDEMTNPE